MPKGGRLAFRLMLAVSAWAFLIPGPGLVAAQNLEVPLISPDDLKPGVCSPNLTVIDVLAPADWEASDPKIKCVVRGDPHDMASWAQKYPRYRDIVLYCA